MTRRPNPLDPDEIQMEALGALIDEHLERHPGDSYDEAYDAVCFKVLRRAEEIYSSRIAAMNDQREYV